MHIDPAALTHANRYKFLTGAMVPRPIAWVSTMDAQGNLNLAPFSYFTGITVEPLTLLFCPQIPLASGVKKDTLRNIEEVPEFVINLTNEETADAMNRSAALLPHGESEFEWAGVTPAPSTTIRVPRVAEAPIAFECVLHQIVTISDKPGGGAAVIGRVTHIVVRDDIYDTDRGYVRLDALKPIGRLAGSQYTRVTDLFDLVRPVAPQIDD